MSRVVVAFDQDQAEMLRSVCAVLGSGLKANPGAVASTFEAAGEKIADALGNPHHEPVGVEEAPRVFDCRGNEIKVGSRVTTGLEDPGTVMDITAPDQDADEAGNPRPINPFVCVQWDNVAAGDFERISTRWLSESEEDHRPDFECDEIELLTQPQQVSSSDGVGEQ